MSGDIGPGTLVVCINDGPCAGRAPALQLKNGRAYTVAAVNVVPAGYLDAGAVGLELHGVAADHTFGFYIERFRKLNDGEDDAELIARIRQCKPVRTPEPVSHAGFHSRPAEGERSHPLALTPLDGERA